MPTPPASASTVKLDDVSKQTIEHLQEDGRRSYAEIGRAVGLSEAAVRQRVQRLIDGGVMQIVAVTDPLQVGFTRQAMIGLNVEGDLSPVGDALAAMDEVSYVVTTAGSFDILAEVVCEDDDDLLALLDHHQPFPAAAEGPRGRQGTPQKQVHLPEGWLDDPEELVVPTDAELDSSGG